jgi:hypothetical protein
VYCASKFGTRSPTTLKIFYRCRRRRSKIFSGDGDGGKKIEAPQATSIKKIIFKTKQKPILNSKN